MFIALIVSMHSLQCIDTFEAYIHFGAGLSFVARSDCMGNAKASSCGTSYGKKLPAFLYVCGKREDTIKQCSVGESYGRNYFITKMIETICLTISAICFISSYGCHMILYKMYESYIDNGSDLWLDLPGYLENPFLCNIPIISGLILAVIPECFLFNLSWYWVTILNIVVIFILGPLITKLYLFLMASKKGLGYDVLNSLLIGIISFILGIII